MNEIETSYRHGHGSLQDQSESQTHGWPGSSIPQRSILHILWDRWPVVLLTFVVCGIAALIYLAKSTPVYTSSSRLYVEQTGPRIIAANEGFMTQSKNYLYTQAELLKSTPILVGAMEAMGEENIETFGDTSDRLGFLKKRVDVTVGKKDDIINVSMDSPYPQEAARIVNSIVESYIAYHSRQQRNTATEILKILQREKSRRDAEREGRFQAAMEFKQKNETISFGTDNSNIIIQRLIKLSDALTQAEMEMMDARSQYETTKAMLGDPRKLEYLAEAGFGSDKSGSAYYELGVLRTDMRKLQLELTSLRQQCTPDHPAVRDAQARLKELSDRRKERLQLLAESNVAMLQQRLVAARSHTAELGKSLDRQRARAQELNSKAVQYAVLETELKRTERMCDIIDSRIKEIDVTEDAGALNISILEIARAEDIPSKPKKARIMALSTIMGLLLGAGFALLGNWMDHRLRSVADISQALGLSVVGVIPHVPGKKGSNNIGRTVEFDPLSQAAEAYRTVRTALYFGAPDSRTKTVLVTSPASGDGKTTLASNLGMAMAQAGQKVLILDADFRKPSQQTIFPLDNEDVGLCTVLAGGAPMDEAIRHTPIKGLDLLPCGTIPPNPSEILNSKAFASLLDDFSRHYDYVLLDAPPVMPVADARILGALCDVALLVLRVNKSSRKPSQQAVEALLKVGTQILGVVVNDITARKSGYGYYEEGCYYGYGKRGRKDRTQEREEGQEVRADAA